MPKRLVFPTVYRRFITQKSYISFIVAKALDHIQTLAFGTENQIVSFALKHTAEGLQSYET
jgi:hypothetical protein